MHEGRKKLCSAQFPGSPCCCSCRSCCGLTNCAAARATLAKLKFAALVLAVALASLPRLSLISCGSSGSGGSGGGQPTSANTPPDTYTVNLVVTIKAAARSVPLILTVQ